MAAFEATLAQKPNEKQGQPIIATELAYATAMWGRPLLTVINLDNKPHLT